MSGAPGRHPFRSTVRSGDPVPAGRTKGPSVRKTLATIALALAPLVGAAVNTGATLARETPQPSEKPNIVVVMTDDQDVASLRYMPKVQKLLVDRGMTFKEQTAVFPLCCPVRAA